ncbi:MAG: hypothetical protein WB869_06830 [Candidatus Acidiferrales bacterium]
MMKKCARFAVAAVFLAVALVGASSLRAATIYVGTCGTPNKTTIQAAVNASAAGGTVLICPGTYPEQVTITKNLTVSGVASANMNQVVIASPAGGVAQNTYDLYMSPSFPVAAQVLVQNATVSLRNVTVDGANNGINNCALDIRGIYYQNASGTINDVATRNQVLSTGLTGCESGQGIFIQSGYGSTVKEKVTVENSSVTNFQKNGITGDGTTLTVMVMGNYIVGQGPTTGAAENGVQISDGAAGKVMNNATIDEIWAPDTSSDTGDAASGILIYAAENIEVGNNTVGSTQFGIVSVTDPTSGTPSDPQGLGDDTNIHNNAVMGTQIFDGIDVCSNNNMVQNNTIYSSTESGVHVDSTCGSTGTKNNVSGNVINLACAGVLEGATPNNIGNNNQYFNDVEEVMTGNVCPDPSVAAAAVTFGTGSPALSGVHPKPVQ